MITMKDQSLSVYRGDYRPVDMMRNGQQLGGWKTTGMVGDEGAFYGTYHDLLQVYGKSGYREGVNLCPPPVALHDSDDLMELIVTPKTEGRFDLSIATSGKDVVMLMSPIVIHSVTLPAGTYTASSNSMKIGFCSEDEFLYDLPHTFTLTAEQRVSFGFYDTDFAETDLYLQIQAGTAATDYDPYAGDPTKAPAPDNVRPLVSSQGQITTQGKNLFFAGQFSGTQTTRGITVTYEENGIYHLQGTVEVGSSFTPMEFWLDIPCEKDKKYTASAELLSGFTEAAFYAYFGLGETLGSSKNFLAAAVPAEAVVGEVYSRSQIPTNISGVANPNYITRFWLYFHDQQGKRLDCRIRVWLENDDPAEHYTAYCAPVAATVPTLRGIPVSADGGCNYQETVDGEERYYVSDLLWGDRIQRRVGELVLTGAENIQLRATDFSGTNSYFWDGGQVYDTPKAAAFGLCNSLARLTSTAEDAQGILFGDEDTFLYLRLSKTDFPDAETVKSWLAERYAAGEPVTVYYLLDTPVTESHTQSPYPTALPNFSRITVTTPFGLPRLGMASCIKVKR